MVAIVEYKTTTPHNIRIDCARPSKRISHGSQYCPWKKKYGDLGMAALQRLKILEDENARLKQIVAALTSGWQKAAGGCPKNSLELLKRCGLAAWELPQAL